MLYITQPEVMDNIIKHLFKAKRKTPKIIGFGDSAIIISWENNRTSIIECFAHTQLETSEYDGRLYIKICIEPYKKDTNKYRYTAIYFDIKKDIFVYNP